MDILFRIRDLTSKIGKILSFSDMEKEIDHNNIKNRGTLTHAQIESELSNLETDVNNIDNNITTIQGNITNLETDVSNIDTEITALQALSHNPVTTLDTTTIAFTLNGQQISADVNVALFIMKSLITAKGQLIVGTGNGAVAVLNPGANGQMIIADSTQPVGLKFTPVPAAGIDRFLYKYKANSQIMNDLGLFVDGDFTQAVEANTVYDFHFEIYFAGAAGVSAQKVRCQFSAPTGTDGKISGFASESGVPNDTYMQILGNSEYWGMLQDEFIVDAARARPNMSYIFTGMFKTGGSAGNITFSWGLAAPFINNVTMAKHSKMRLIKIS